MRQVGILIPGMANLHSHAFQRAMAGLAEHRAGGATSFWSWRNLMYKLANSLSPETCEGIAAFLYMELLKGGYTGVAEFHYVHGVGQGRDRPLEMSLAIVNAAKRVGIDLTHLPVLYERSGFEADGPLPEQQAFSLGSDDFLSLYQTLKRHMGDDPSCRLGTAFHSLRAVRPEILLKVTSALTSAWSTDPIHIHIAEQVAEVEAALAHLGKRPMSWLLDQVEVDERWCLVHATHLDREEAQKAATSGAVAGLCPTTEGNLGDGFFGLSDWLSDGGRIGIGSDSNVCTSAAEELRLLEYGARLSQQRRLVVTEETTESTGAALWLKAATDGWRALGSKAGAIAIGGRANFLGLNPDHPSLLAAQEDQVFDCLVFGPSQGAIADVFVGGQLVIEGGRHALEDEIEATYKRALTDLMQLD